MRMPRTRIHTGSLPGSLVSGLNVDMLIAVCNQNPDLLHAMGCDLTGREPFAKTTTGLELYDVRGLKFPAVKYGMRVEHSILMAYDDDARAETVKSIMMAVKGLDVKSLAIYVTSPIQYHSIAEPTLVAIAETLVGRDFAMADIYLLSNAVGMCEYNHVQQVLHNKPEFGQVISDGGLICRVCSDVSGCWWYYSECGKGTAKILRVSRESQFTHNLIRLAVPEKLDGFRVVAIDDKAFVQTEVDRMMVGEPADEWQEVLEELTIPRYVSQMNVRCILDSLPSLKRVMVDSNNHYFEEDGKMLIRQIYPHI